MKALFSSRRHGLERECLFWCPLVTEWDFYNKATRSGKRR